MLKVKIFESQIILKSLEARQSKSLNRIDKNPLRSPMPKRSEYLSFNNNYMIGELLIF
jgi:hypothetical protein